MFVWNDVLHAILWYHYLYVHGLEQGCDNSITNVLELPCIKWSICYPHFNGLVQNCNNYMADALELLHI